MSLGQRGYRSVTIVLAATLLSTLPVGAVEVTIDSFAEATNTKIIPATQIVANMQGQSTTASDSGLSGVVGGVRKVTVEATFIGGAVDNVTSGVEDGAPGYCYNSTNNADGTALLVYDRGGLGLQELNLSHAQGLQIGVFAADASSTPYSAKLTLEDATGNSASSSQMSSEVCSGAPECSPLQFPFTDFITVNLRRIVRITLLLDPNQAGDIFYDPIMTYGTPDEELICDDGEDNDNNGLTDCQDPACTNALNCIETAPLLSPGMVGALVAMLGVVGVVGLRRVRQGL